MKIFIECNVRRVDVLKRSLDEILGHGHYRIIEAGEPVAWRSLQYSCAAEKIIYLYTDDVDEVENSTHDWEPLYLHPSGDAKDAALHNAYKALQRFVEYRYPQIDPTAQRQVDDSYREIHKLLFGAAIEASN